VILRVVYCAALTGLGTAALARLYRACSLRTLVATLAVFETLALTLAVALGLAFGADPYLLMIRLAADALFFLTPALLIAVAVLLRRRAARAAAASGALALALLAVAADALLVEPHWLQVTFTRLESAKLTRPVRLVLVADVQADALGPYERDVLRHATELGADLILYAGDYLQTPADTRDALRDQFNQYLRTQKHGARLGVFAVKGNRDLGPWYEMFDGCDVRVVHDSESFDLGELTLTCLSGDDSFDSSARIPAAPEGRFHLVLGHSPDCALSASRADLILAGHTHGGQVRLPLLGPVATLSQVPRWMAAGLAERPAGGLLYVSRGVGMERG